MRKVFVIGAAALVTACASTPPCEDEVMAFVMAQQFIKDDLKAPATAQFAMITEPGNSSVPTKLPDGKCAFNVLTHVDAQNSFGATIRAKYFVTLAPDGAGRWSLISIVEI